jgi:hypothetical protein
VWKALYEAKAGLKGFCQCWTSQDSLYWSEEIFSSRHLRCGQEGGQVLGWALFKVSQGLKKRDSNAFFHRKVPPGPLINTLKYSIIGFKLAELFEFEA